MWHSIQCLDVASALPLIKILSFFCMHISTHTLNVVCVERETFKWFSFVNSALRSINILFILMSCSYGHMNGRDGKDSHINDLCRLSGLDYRIRHVRTDGITSHPSNFGSWSTNNLYIWAVQEFPSRKYTLIAGCHELNSQIARL